MFPFVLLTSMQKIGSARTSEAEPDVDNHRNLPRAVSFAKCFCRHVLSGLEGGTDGLQSEDAARAGRWDWSMESVCYVRRKSQSFLPRKLGFSHSTRCRDLAARRFPETGMALNLGILSGSIWKAGVPEDELGEGSAELCSS